LCQALEAIGSTGTSTEAAALMPQVKTEYEKVQATLLQERSVVFSA
jgi:hypothetical protein